MKQDLYQLINLPSKRQARRDLIGSILINTFCGTVGASLFFAWAIWVFRTL